MRAMTATVRCGVGSSGGAHGGRGGAFRFRAPPGWTARTTLLFPSKEARARWEDVADYATVPLDDFRHQARIRSVRRSVAASSGTPRKNRPAVEQARGAATVWLDM